MWNSCCHILCSLSLSQPHIACRNRAWKVCPWAVYLQEELETMKTAFQMCLSHYIDKWYQYQLILEQRRNRQSSLLVRTQFYLVHPHSDTRTSSYATVSDGNATNIKYIAHTVSEDMSSLPCTVMHQLRRMTIRRLNKCMPSIVSVKIPVKIYWMVNKLKVSIVL